MRPRVLCLRESEEEVGRGLYCSAVRVGEYILKIRLADGNARELAKRVLERNLELREKLDFLPKFYGVVVTGVEVGESVRVAVVSFHEYVEPIRITRIPVAEVVRLVERAAGAGFVLDMKPSNFGRKEGKLYYLDEGGIGRGPIPPDVIEEWKSFLQKMRERVRIRQ